MRRRTITHRPVRRRLRATTSRAAFISSPLEASGLRSRVPRVGAEVSPAVRPSSGSPAPGRGPLGSREIPASRRAAPHLRASPSRVPRDRGRASGRRSARSGEVASARPSAVSSSASAIVTRPISRAVTSASRRFSRSSARRKIVRGWPCEVDAPPLRGRDGRESLSASQRPPV
jgi:hypothetical protein